MATIKQPVVVVDVSPSSASFRSPSIIMSGLPADEISREHYAIATASIPGISIKLNDAFILAPAPSLHSASMTSVPPGLTARTALKRLLEP